MSSAPVRSSPRGAHVLDGVYYPRFFFVDRNGNIDYSVAASTEGQIYRYIYSKTAPFKENMRKILAME